MCASILLSSFVGSGGPPLRSKVLPTRKDELPAVLSLGVLYRVTSRCGQITLQTSTTFIADPCGDSFRNITVRSSAWMMCHSQRTKLTKP